MYKRICLFWIFLAVVSGAWAQENDTVRVETADPQDAPEVFYSTPKRYKIADIRVTGVTGFDDFVLVGFSGLSVGDEVSIPGEEITDAVKRFWRHGLFSDVKIIATKIEDGKVWLEIRLKQRPRISGITYHGVKKGEREDLETRVGLRPGSQITPNLMDRAKTLINKYFDEKGFKNVEIEITERENPAKEGEVFVDIDISKNQKTKIHRIHFSGNRALSDATLKKAMKKTNEKFSLRNDFKSSIREMFSTKKFVSSEYDNDKENIIAKYNEHGYRDAVIVRDSVVNYNDSRVDIYIDIDEGQKYYLKGVTFVGNTKYPTDALAEVLGMKTGDVYNQKKLDDRLYKDEDAVSNYYYNNGYLFFNADPVEVDVDNDSIALEIRITEGPQATINRIIINGNDRVYEDIVRRELRTKPGMLFSRDDLMRSAREIAQMGHFDPENMDPRPIPDAENGTVDIQYNLVSKANDQVEFSAGWGQTGIIGKLSLKFSNFSMKNLFHPKTYKGIIPQGEGQSLTLSGQTNGRYYQAYSISFMDPWFGGKRPNMLSASIYYSKQTDMSTRYFSKNYNPYSYYYGNNGYYDNGSYDFALDPDKSIQMMGLSIGYGKRLKWPDDYFQFMATLNYQLYIMKDWNYFLNVRNGTCNNINLELSLSRSSIDNPLYTRYGSEFLFSVAATPPYSLWDGKDYANMKADDKTKYRFVEYHKWKFKAKIFSPLAPMTVKRTPVLMTRVEYGFLGSYNKNKLSPFETFYMGGDGMTGYGVYAMETIGLRGYENGSIIGNNGQYGYAYSRLAMELRYPFLLEPTSTIYALVFAEAGNAWADIKNFNPFDLKRSAGVGVRIFLPMIGMMGIDWGYGFDKVNGSRSAGGSQFHFVIGQEF